MVRGRSVRAPVAAAALRVAAGRSPAFLARGAGQAAASHAARDLSRAAAGGGAREAAAGKAVVYEYVLTFQLQEGHEAPHPPPLSQNQLRAIALDLAARMLMCTVMLSWHCVSAHWQLMRYSYSAHLQGLWICLSCHQLLRFSQLPGFSPEFWSSGMHVMPCLAGSKC